LFFLTQFSTAGIQALDIMMQFLKPYPITLFLAHLAKKEDVWNEIKLSGYPEPPLSNGTRGCRPSTAHRFQREPGQRRLENFVQENAIDMISLSSSRRNIFARIFKPGNRAAHAVPFGYTAIGHQGDDPRRGMFRFQPRFHQLGDVFGGGIHVHNGRRV